MGLGCSGERSALWGRSALLCLGLVAATGCYRSHGLDDGSNAFDRDSGTDAMSDASDLDAGRSADAGLLCEFTYETPGATASCVVSGDAEESCREAARCICSSGVDTPWLFDSMGCVESALVARALRTFADYCRRPGPSLGEAVRGFGDFWGADVTTSPGCDDIPAVAFDP